MKTVRAKVGAAVSLFITALSLAIILYLTLFSFRIPWSVRRNTWAWWFAENFHLVEPIANVVVFVPLGIGLAGVLRKRLGTGSYVIVQTLGTLLSVSVEAVQFFINRNPSYLDVVANSVGVAAGYALYAAWRHFTRTGERKGRP